MDRVARRFRGAGERGDALADINNRLNYSATTGEVETVGPSLGRPTAILDSRYARIGIQLNIQRTVSPCRWGREVIPPNTIS